MREEIKCLNCDEPCLAIYQLKTELEDKIDILNKTLDKIYSSGWFDRYKTDKKLCPNCNSILVEPTFCNVVNERKAWYWCKCGHREIKANANLPVALIYNDDRTDEWNIVNIPKHPLETLKLKYIEELNLINIAIVDLNTQ